MPIITSSEKNIQHTKYNLQNKFHVLIYLQTNLFPAFNEMKCFDNKVHHKVGTPGVNFVPTVMKQSFIRPILIITFSSDLFLGSPEDS